ncbi:MAG: VIT domain-containing protein [Pirellulaceae bacterium]
MTHFPSRRQLFLVLACLLAGVAWFQQPVARGQGVLVEAREDQPYHLPRPVVIWPPRPPMPPRPAPEPSYKIKELSVEVRLEDQIAQTQVNQSFTNTGSRELEVRFLFPLPYDGAIERVTFLVDGREFDAKLLTAEEARRIYERHVRRNRDPALVEWIGTGMFQTSVFPVPAGASRTVTLKFSQLCRQQQGLTELLFPFSTAKYTTEPVEKVRVEVALRSKAKIKNIYSPTHGIEVRHTGEHAAQVTYSAAQTLPSTDFRLLYDTGTEPVGANVLSYKPERDDDGYLMLLVSPDIRSETQRSLPKTVVFVVDRSGSMSGKKIEQAKGALRFVLNNLQTGDLFNIVAYDNGVETFRPELQRFDEEARQAALGYVESLYAGGSTNIAGALQAAFDLLRDDSRPNYVVFLTDGLPTVGERNEAKIAAQAKEHNRVRARLFGFGVGYDVNSRLLDKVARLCHGQSQYVRPNEDIETHVSQLYDRIGAPVLTDVSILFDQENFPAERGQLVNRLYPRTVQDLFAGEQLVLVGRYKRGGAAKVTIRGRVGTAGREYHYPATLVEHSPHSTLAFVEKLWAMRRVGEIIDEIDLQGKNQELIDELISLAKKHGILTPYTSFLADEDARLHDVAEFRQQAGVALDSLQISEGLGGFVQRDMKAQLQQSTQPAAPAYSLDPASPGMAAGGMAGGRLGGSTPLSIAPGAPTYRRVEDDVPVAVTSVRQIGDKTFYRRDQRWVDSTVTAAQEKAARRVERFSDEYFELISTHGRALTQYLPTGEEILLVLGDQAYVF